MSLYTTIRALYPDPVPDAHASATSYCVGGALCMYLDSGGELEVSAHLNTTRFPEEHALCEALRVANPHLEEATASDLAYEIVQANDAGCMAYAWDLMRHALTPSKETD